MAREEKEQPRQRAPPDLYRHLQWHWAHQSPEKKERISEQTQQVTTSTPRRPVDPMTIPQRIGYSTDDHGVDFYKVVYPSRVLCRDGVYRKNVHYACRTRRQEVGSAEHRAGQTLALRRAWAHCELPTSAVPSPHGIGPLQGDGLVKFHGSDRNDHCFHVHPTGSHAAAKNISVWRTDTDTIHQVDVFCKNCEYVRLRGDGVTIYRCLGHDVSPGAVGTAPGIAEPAAAGSAAPPAVSGAASPATPPVDASDEAMPGTAGATKGGTLKGHHLVESFSGDPNKGGCCLSRTWTADGGTAEARDVLIDPVKHDFNNDQNFWTSQKKSKEQRTYQYAPPCSTFSKACSTPALRSKDNPYGSPTNTVVQEAN